MKRAIILLLTSVFSTAALSNDDAMSVARADLNAGNTAASIDASTQALGAAKVATDSARKLHAVRGEAYLEEKNYSAAIDDLTAAIGSEADPSDVCSLVGDVFLLRAKAGIAVFKFRDAIEDMKAATVCEPTSPETWTGLGNAYFGLLHGQDAVAAYSHALQLSPTYEEALLQRGKNFENAHMFDRALADYAAVLNGDPNNAQVYNNRATIYAGMGRFDDAVADLCKSIQLDPTNFVSFINRGWAYFYEKKYALAHADADEAQKLHDSPDFKTKFEPVAGPVFTKMMEYQLAALQQALNNVPG